MENYYANLNLGPVDGAPDILPDNEFTISSHPAETVRIFTARYGREFVYGYQFIWPDGRNSFRNPSPVIGRFNSENDAVLHCIGFFRQYREYMSSDAYENILAAERRFTKPVLPFDMP